MLQDGSRWFKILCPVCVQNGIVPAKIFAVTTVGHRFNVCAVLTFQTIPKKRSERVEDVTILLEVWNGPSIRRTASILVTAMIW